MKKQTISRKELYDLVWSQSLISIAEKYSTSAGEISKMCVKMNIPLPKPGHWTKLRFNKPVEKMALPENHKGENEITFYLREEGDPGITAKPSPLADLTQEIIAQEGDKLIVPVKLTQAHKLIIREKQIEELRSRLSWRHPDYPSHSDRLKVIVTKEQLERAYRILDTFFKVIESRGHKILIRQNKTYLIIQGQEIEIYLYEKYKRVPKNSNHSWPEYDHLPTGILMFNIVDDFRPTNLLKDGKIPLEKQLPLLIAMLEIKGEEIKQRMIDLEISRAKQKESERIKKDKQEQKEKELNDFNELLKKSKRWHEAEIMRNYINKVDAKAKKNNNYTEDLKEWISWARKKADCYDPLFLETPQPSVAVHSKT